jgi:dTDP-4-dehydrorhamnose reductase
LLALNWAMAVHDRCEVILGCHKRNVILAGTCTKWIDLDYVDNFVRVLEEVKPQTVIHTAGLTSVEKCESQPELAHQVNVALASNVAKASTLYGIKLVHISTDHLFSGEESFVAEDQPVAPRNIYGKTKAEAEYRVLEANSQALVIRTNFYGWGTSYRRSFSDVVIDPLRAGKVATLFKDAFFTPILVETLATTVHDLIDRNASGIYHVVGDERISKYEFGLRIAEKFDLDPQGITSGLIGDRPDLVRRPRDMSLSNQKTNVFLGRKLGGVDQHLNRLVQQQHEDVARIIQNV